METNDFFFEKAYQLKPLFAELMQSVEEYQEGGLVPFCMQWGKHFPQEENDGIMFYGRATNGWVTLESDVDKLFDINFDDRIFFRDDQMQWVDDCAGNTGNYNTNNSAFWRVIRRTASAFYPQEPLHHIAWSNVCKIAPDGGNPSDALFYAQLPSARAIMQKEIEIFSPKHIVLLTGKAWAQDFLYFLNGSQSTKSIKSYKWGSENQYMVKVYQIGGVHFYLSEHPQGKNEDTHVDVLVKAIRSQC